MSNEISAKCRVGKTGNDKAYKYNQWLISEEIAISRKPMIINKCDEI